MNIVGNTLRMAEILEKKNFTRKEAREFLELMREEGLSKNDLKSLEEKLENKIELSRKDLEINIKSVEQRLDSKIDSVKKDLEGVEQRLEAKIDSVEQRLEAKIDKEVGSLKEEIREVKTDLAWIKMLGGGLMVGVLAQIFISLFS